MLWAFRHGQFNVFLAGMCLAGSMASLRDGLPTLALVLAVFTVANVAVAVMQVRGQRE